MLKRLTVLFVLLALSGGVLAGTPLHSPNDKMMKCCKRAKSKDRSPIAEATRLCCAVNCSESMPIPSGASFNFSPSNATMLRSIADQIAALFPVPANPPAATQEYAREVLPRKLQPKFIQHKSLLI